LSVFATRSGGPLTDIEGENGPFAVELARHIATLGVDIVEVFRARRVDVLKATNRKQSPFTLAPCPARTSSCTHGSGARRLCRREKRTVALTGADSAHSEPLRTCARPQPCRWSSAPNLPPLSAHGIFFRISLRKAGPRNYMLKQTCFRLPRGCWHGKRLGSAEE
jgi:hypothetical protein